ncbi:hypothetical protein CAP35_11515 [Chitinophagaceae bacterium IBVUCB1]|nr:hypothetical protein CAP35_11515 [Chitinophagaceae bacterium IBVUCB1]
MKIIIISILLLLCYTSYCQTQYDLNMEAKEAFQKADSELNIIYKKVIKLHSADSIFISNLKKSQRLWTQFRDAEMDMMYPDYGPLYPYGSVRPMCWSYYKESLTRERIKTLMQWIVGIDEGDVCRGTIPSK